MQAAKFCENIGDKAEMPGITREDHLMNQARNQSQSIGIIPSRFSPILGGLAAGLFAAAVLFQRDFPTWVPVIFSEYPILFFMLFIVPFGCIGYIWALADDSFPEKPVQRTPGYVLNTIITGMICGLFGAAVLYDKDPSPWVPDYLTAHPFLFFSLFILVCGILGYIWTLPDASSSGDR